MTLQRVLGVSWRTGTDKPYQSDGMVQEGRAEKHSYPRQGHVLKSYQLWHNAFISRRKLNPLRMPLERFKAALILTMVDLRKKSFDIFG